MISSLKPVPITESWRDELRDMTERAGLGLPKEEPKEQPVKRTSVYSAETGRLIPPPSRAMSRGFSRQSRNRERDIRGGFVNLTSDQDNEVLVSLIYEMCGRLQELNCHHGRYCYMHFSASQNVS